MDEPEINDGNFQALLRYRAKVDDVLQDHLQNSSKSATYLSPQIQNKILSIIQN